MGGSTNPRTLDVHHVETSGANWQDRNRARQTPRRMGRCLGPPHPISVTSSENSDAWRFVWIRRNALRNSELVPSRDPPSGFEGRWNLYWEVVAWNIDWACRRMVRVEFMRDDMQIDPITLGGGAPLHAPPDGEDPLALPSGALALRPPLGPRRVLFGFGRCRLPLRHPWRCTFRQSDEAWLPAFDFSKTHRIRTSLRARQMPETCW